MSEKPICELCGEPMPAGEEMFKYHGYSGPCPKPPLPKIAADTVTIPRAQHEALMAAADWIRVLHPMTGSDILAALRAASIETEEG